MEWETILGLEVHAQLATKSKIFSGASTQFGAEANTQACGIDLGLPGVLPVLNQAAVEMAIKFALGSNAEVARKSVFARKNYFYPDLPKGYQISQYELPIVSKGYIDIQLDDGNSKRIHITRAHLEEDAGKSLHEDFDRASGIDLKNINSFRFIERAINYEVERQITIISSGGKIIQETRLYDPTLNETRSMRSKEEANDYRYFPDPDLLPLIISDELIVKVKQDLPELPPQKKQRFIDQYGLSSYDANILISSKDMANYYESVVHESHNEAKLAANWITSELLGALNKAGFDINNTPISAIQLGKLILRISDNTISGKIAKSIFER